MRLYHGTRSDKPVTHFSREHSRDDAVVAWLSPDKWYAADYGSVQCVYVHPSQVLDLRTATDCGKYGWQQVERSLAEWQAVFASKGLRVSIDAEQADVECKLWDLLYGGDIDMRDASDLASVLLASAYDALICYEVGTRGRATAIGMLREFDAK